MNYTMQDVKGGRAVYGNGSLIGLLLDRRSHYVKVFHRIPPPTMAPWNAYRMHDGLTLSGTQAQALDFVTHNNTPGERFACPHCLHTPGESPCPCCRQ